MEKLFYIFRHGQSTYNISGVIQGRTNLSVLTDIGRRQAFNLGKKLYDKNIQIILTSPLSRARETAEIANQLLNIPIIEDNRLTEINMGEIEGMHYTDVCKKYAKQYEIWREEIHSDFKFNNGESKNELFHRIYDAISDYAENYSYQNFAISTHGIAIYQILHHFNQTLFNIQNGTILSLKYDGKWHFNGFL